MQIKINGNTVSLDQAVTITELLAIRGLTGKRLATEINGEILPRSQYGQYTLRDGDVLEIVGAVGGG